MIDRALAFLHSRQQDGSRIMRMKATILSYHIVPGKFIEGDKKEGSELENYVSFMIRVSKKLH